MRRYLNPFVLIFSLLALLGYSYLAWSASNPGSGLRYALGLGFFLVWVVPVVYWSGNKEQRKGFDKAVMLASFLAMGWLSFFFSAVVLRDLALLVFLALGQESLVATLRKSDQILLGISLVALALGVAGAYLGPTVKRVKIHVPSLPKDLVGITIVQISDLHIGLTIGKRYVEKVVRKANSLDADMIALTGDIVDGPVSRLEASAAPLAELKARHGSFFITGNHEYYSGAEQWITWFRSKGIKVLLNSSEIITRGGSALLVGGIVDPAIKVIDKEEEPRPDLAAKIPEGTAKPVGFRLLLAHNPKLAPAGARAGFDLQLSGHTHSGQFIPWNLVVHLVHKPHTAGLSREGSMQVYVSPGTGSWGPPVRLGTRTEITYIELV